MSFPPRAVLETRLSLIKHNCRLLKRICEGRFFCPMVKTDAYGHGAAPVTRALYEAGALQAGVISAEEARQIREAAARSHPEQEQSPRREPEERQIASQGRAPQRRASKQSLPDLLIFGPILNKEAWDWTANAAAEAAASTEASAEAAEAAENGGRGGACLPVISNRRDLEHAAKAAKTRAERTAKKAKNGKETQLPVHLKFDAGFSRLGFPLKEAEKVRNFLKNAPLLKLKGIALQLTEGGEAAVPGTLSFKQREELKKLRRFFQAPAAHSLNTEALFALAKAGQEEAKEATNSRKKQGPIHSQTATSARGARSGGGGRREPAKNSAGGPGGDFFPDKADDGARPGIGLYGPFAPAASAAPSADLAAPHKTLTAPSSNGLQTASSLKSFIVGTRRLKKGGRVSYSGTWRAKRDSFTATVSLGYGDGFLKSLSNKGLVIYRGKLCPVIGRICMDFFMTDITDAAREGPEPKPGEEVVIFGSQKGKTLSAADQAALAGALPHELLAGLGCRIRRIFAE